MEKDNHSGILLSCYNEKTIKGENVIITHAFAYQISGTLLVKDGKKMVSFKPGDFRFNVRNKLAKFIKQPEASEPFRALSLTFDEELLKEFAKEHKLTASTKRQTPPSFQLKKDPLYQSFADSLRQSTIYFDSNNKELIRHKLKEALLVLVTVQPELKDILFNFDDPGKINLQSFMETHFHFQLQLHQMAYLSGRSVSGFKRDFYKTFAMTPEKWIKERRLQEAYYLLKEDRLRINEVYNEVGFENLSHFSFAFKKRFGITPAKIRKE